MFGWINNLLPFPDVLMLLGLNLPSKCIFCDSIDSLHHFFKDCRVATNSNKKEEGVKRGRFVSPYEALSRTDSGWI